MTEKDIQIESRDLNLWYGGTQALKSVSMDIPENKVTAVIGPSGCGKSGKNIYDRDMDVVAIRKKIGMVFQKPNPFPMSIYDNIAYGPRLHGMCDKHELDNVVEMSLKSAALWDEVAGKLDVSALDLSGGQQQRLCIARTLAVKPDVILFDEPCSALDPISTAKIEDLIGELKRDYTIIIVTHNMRAGSKSIRLHSVLPAMIELGKTKQIFENPEKKSTEDYITGRFG
jgi:phosphate transport system ATP-binding protein